MIVFDEHGEKWEVARGDPAYDAVRYLTRAGYKTIRLPLAILLASPSLPQPTIDHLHILEGDSFLRYISLLDQVVCYNGREAHGEENHRCRETAKGAASAGLLETGPVTN